MDFLIEFFKGILHLDQSLAQLINNFGYFTYAILFLIIFCETGLVFTPFLPGDSLIFAAGALTTKSILNPIILTITLSLAAIIGDTLNYWIGFHFGKKILEKNIKFFHKDHFEKAKKFYDEHGGKTIIIARFVPIIRTFAPFVAGFSQMNYKKFLSFNIFGGLIWVNLFLLTGYWFGNLKIVQDNFSYIIFIIIGISIFPVLVNIIKNKLWK